MRRVVNLPDEWYEDIEPGVRRLHPPGVDFSWHDVVLAECSTEAATRYLVGLDLPPEIVEAAVEARGESIRVRQLGTGLLRLEIPAEVLVDSDRDYLLSIIHVGDRLVTVRRHRIGIVEDACGGIAEWTEGAVNILAAMAELGDEFLDRLAPSLRRTAEELDDAESELEDSRAARIDRIAHVRRLLLGLDRHLDPLQSAIQRSLLDQSTRHDGPDLESLRGLQERANWFEHRIHGQLDRVRVISDREHVQAMDDLSNSMYRLSWIATIFLPLTFVTGLLGINVGGIPFAGSAVGFWAVCGILVLIAVGTAVGLTIVVRSGRRRAAGIESRREERRS